MKAEEKNSEHALELYQDVVLDHGLRPRNFRPLADADRQADGMNHLCGDRVTVYVRMKRQRVHKATFTGSGCAVCKASASLMTGWVQSRTLDEIQTGFETLRKAMTGTEGDEAGDELGTLGAMKGVRNYRARLACATLPWRTLLNALTSAQAESNDETK